MTSETLSSRFATTITILLLIAGVSRCESFYGRTTDQNPSERVIDAQTNNVTPMHKVLLTQRGYIQFLRWELPVPEIEEFTFCVWVKSTNLTYPHSIFSYSKDEKNRLVRAWISAQGQSVHLEIDNVEIFFYPTFIEEHRWYHICESWTNVNGRFALWIDGHKAMDGYSPEISGHVIPSKGDIVLGQEYTDFDKGLEEGVEGAVLGFNLILSSAFESPRLFFERNKLEDVGLQSETDTIDYEAGSSEPTHESQYPQVASEHPVFSRIMFPQFGSSEVRSTAFTATKRTPRVLSARSVDGENSRRKRKSINFRDWENVNTFETVLKTKPLGQQLVDMSFKHCEQGRGSPHIGGKLMLISWTRTPVKVFGGAIVKNAQNHCGNF
ncbi:uncharacterized protein [Venturia canescens]|uniref:uncharacterized protein n=1 Tax=Venturia canescens TaxID=32260 RepID=UPI001C9D435C|nr:uncharacterized protein LOC122412890 [Venturia canescens]